MRTARPDVAEPRARRPGRVDLLREPPVEADGKRRGHLRAQRARDRALGDDPFDAAVQVAGTEMQDAHRRGLVARHQKRFGTLIVSPAWTSVDSLALISTFLPLTTRSILMLPLVGAIGHAARHRQRLQHVELAVQHVLTRGLDLAGDEELVGRRDEDEVAGAEADPARAPGVDVFPRHADLILGTDV